MHSRLYALGESHRRCYLHLYYNAEMKAHAVDRFNKELIACKEELKLGHLRPEHQEQYAPFFIITTTPVRRMKIIYNHESVHQYNKQILIEITKSQRKILELLKIPSPALS